MAGMRGQRSGLGALGALAEDLGFWHPFQEAHNHITPIPGYSGPLLTSGNTSHAHSERKLVHINKPNKSFCIVQVEGFTAVGTSQVPWG